MDKHKFFLELDEICYKYKRLKSQISILQMFVAECVDITGEPKGGVSDFLYEVEMQIEENNEKLEKIIRQEVSVS